MNTRLRVYCGLCCEWTGVAAVVGLIICACILVFEILPIIFTTLIYLYWQEIFLPPTAYYNVGQYLVILLITNIIQAVGAFVLTLVGICVGQLGYISFKGCKKLIAHCEEKVDIEMGKTEGYTKV